MRWITIIAQSWQGAVHILRRAIFLIYRCITSETYIWSGMKNYYYFVDIWGCFDFKETETMELMLFVSICFWPALIWSYKSNIYWDSGNIWSDNDIQLVTLNIKMNDIDSFVNPQQMLMIMFTIFSLHQYMENILRIPIDRGIQWCP